MRWVDGDTGFVPTEGPQFTTDRLLGLGLGKGERKADKGEGIRTHAKKGQRKGEPSLGAERLSLQPPRLMWESLSS